MHNFQWESWQEGQPILVLVVNQDFENDNRMNVELSGINVQPVPIEKSSDNVMMIAISVGAFVVISVGFMFLKNRGGEDYYYEDEDEDSYYEETWESKEESTEDLDDEELDDED
jgi:hypothetical protein